MIALPFLVQPALGQHPVPVEPRAAAPAPDRVVPERVVRSGAPDASGSRYGVRLRSLGGVTLPAARASERPDSDLPRPMRYVLGGTFAVLSVGSLVTSVRLGVATVDAFQSDAPLTDGLGVLVGFAAAGAVGFSVTMGVLSVRLFRGKMMLLPPSR